MRSVMITFELPADAYRTLLPLMQYRQITANRLAQKLMLDLAAGVADGRVPTQRKRPPALPKVVRSTEPKRRQLQPDKIKQLAELHTAGKAAAEVAMTVGCSTNTVARYIDKLGLPRHPRGPRRDAA